MAEVRVLIEGYAKETSFLLWYSQILKNIRINS